MVIAIDRVPGQFVSDKRLQNIKRQFLDLFIVLLVLLCSISGAFEPLDNALKSFRFGVATRPATGNIVFVAIDPKSLASVGVWPWPRHVHAELIDKLLDLDVSDIVFDVDFSAASNERDDALMEAALVNAGGFVSLAGFAQQKSARSDELEFTEPLPRFAAEAGVVAVNVRTSADGVLRRYPYGIRVGDTLYPSLAGMLSNTPAADGEFAIDFGIDPETVNVISVVDILEERVPAAAIAGKQVVVGASALELRDNFTVPRYGILPGAMLQVLAAETLKQNRALISGSALNGATLALFIAIGFLLCRWKFGLAAAVGVVALLGVGSELIAVILQAGSAITIDTTAGHIVFAALALAGLSRELNLRRFLLGKTRRERDVTQRILNRVIADNFDGVLVIAGDGTVLTASRFADEILGLTDGQTTIGADMTKILPPVLATEVKVALQLQDDVVQAPEPHEATIVDRTGAKRVVEYVITLSRVDAEQGRDAQEQGNAVACLTFRDITDRRATETRLTYLAAHDPLTGALSRTKFSELINSAMQSEDGQLVGMTVIMLDLSRFKIINDTMGHASGDELLRQVVERFKGCDVDCVARLGGDSFAAARAGILDGPELDRFCNQVLHSVSADYRLGDRKAMIGAQIGVTTTDDSGYDPDMLISHADMALSAAKASPVNGYAVYSREMDARLNELREMESALRQAIAEDQFFVLYQPQVLLEDQSMVGVEALVRWNHPTLGLVSPAKFIPVAEETGLILDLGRWVLIAACKEAASWPRQVKLAVNVSPMQFEFGDVVEDIKNALELSGLSPAQLDVEITEGLFIANPERVTRKLEEIKALGVGVALDDFGTGFSSLSYLGQLPIDKIKIDQAFVRGLPEDQHAAAIVRAVMTLSESLGKKVVAEGIEDADQAWMLKLAGCHIGQGYYFGKPMAGSDIVARMQHRDANAKTVVAR